MRIPGSKGAYDYIEKLLEKADVKINGRREWDIQISNPDLFRRVLADGTLGLGEAYVEGWWDAERLDLFIFKVIKEQLNEVFRPGLLRFGNFLHYLLNYQTGTRAYDIGRFHYDMGNDLYEAMLGESMIYSCGYWENAMNLDQAQYNKMCLIGDKLYLQPGMSVLDIGCGWGSGDRYLSANYDVEVTGVTVSAQQVEYGEKLCRGYPVRIALCDYRKIDCEVGDRFDRIISIGMFEHVGHKNYRPFFKKARECLKDDGLLLLHTIGSKATEYYTEPWIRKYVFPNSMIPSAAQISQAFDGLFVMEDCHNIGVHYDKTLQAWFDNFDRSWDRLRFRFNPRFYRLWKYYLLSCAALFRARQLQVWQLVLSPSGRVGGYERPVGL